MEREHCRQERVFGELKPAARNETHRWVQLMARRPNGDLVRGEYPRREQGPGKYASGWYKRAIQRAAHDRPSCRQRSAGVCDHSHRLPPCLRVWESMALPDGTRHATYPQLASHFAYLNTHYPEIITRPEAIDPHNPIRDRKDIERVAQLSCRYLLPCSLTRYCGAFAQGATVLRPPPVKALTGTDRCSSLQAVTKVSRSGPDDLTPRR
jgi:hypothetical protein